MPLLTYSGFNTDSASASNLFVYEQRKVWRVCAFACADPESFARGGPTLAFFCFFFFFFVVVFVFLLLFFFLVFFFPDNEGERIYMYICKMTMSCICLVK